MVRFENDLALGVVMCVLFGMLGIFLLMLTRYHRQGMMEQVQLFVVALVMRFAVSVVIYEFDFVKVLGDEDSSGWLAGWALAQRWWQRQVGLFDLPAQLLGAFEGFHQGYGYMVGALFYLIGSVTRMPAAALNCFF